MYMILFVQRVEVDGKRPPSCASDSRGELLDQIRQGVELKSVSYLSVSFAVCQQREVVI
jgi:hypothetical protein